MKTLYIECGMGIAGDMLAASLLELVDSEAMLAKINEVFAGVAEVTATSTKKCGIVGTHFEVQIGANKEVEGEHHHEHHHAAEGHHHHEHSTLQSINKKIADLSISPRVKKDAEAIYFAIATAESKVHDSSVDKIHFHEVGDIDAMVDIVSCAMIMEELGAEKIVASAIAVGSGYVKCQHGILPVPAPATALLLAGIPTYNDGIKGELCTPTGAAIIAHYATSFGEKPTMVVEKIGYGMGTKDFERANCVRVYMGETASHNTNKYIAGHVTEINFNVDDMTGEDMAYATEVLLQAGAREVFATAVMGKKSRMGQLITVICDCGEEDKYIHLIFKHTSTIGVRYSTVKRQMLERSIKCVNSEFGGIRCKVSGSMDTQKSKFEYDDLVAIAKKTGLSLQQIKDIISEGKDDK